MCANIFGLIQAFLHYPVAAPPVYREPMLILHWGA